MPESEVAENASLASPALGEQTPAASGAEQTPEEILGIDDVAGLAGAAVETQVVEPPAPTETLTEEIDLSTTPEWLKPWLADPANGPKLHQLYNRLQLHGQAFETPAAAKEASELVTQAGGVEQLRTLVQDGRESQETDYNWDSGDKAAVSTLATQMFERNPESAAMAVPVVLDLMRQRSPDAYSSLIAERAGESLKSGRVYEWLNDAWQKATKAGAQDVVQGIEQAFETLRKFGLGPQEQRVADPRDAELTKREQAIDQREQEGNRAQYTALRQDTDKEATDRVTAEVRAALEKAYPKAKPGTYILLTDNIVRKVGDRLRANDELTRTIFRVVMPARGQYNFGPQAKTQIANLIFQSAQRLIPAVFKDEMAAFTSTAVAGSKERIGRAESAAKRVDIAGGATPGSAGRPKLTKEKVRGMTDEEVLDA